MKMCDTVRLRGMNDPFDPDIGQSDWANGTMREDNDRGARERVRLLKFCDDGPRMRPPSYMAAWHA